jgi:3-deoxy-D-manno-octulosonic-acid transferase
MTDPTPLPHPDKTPASAAMAVYLGLTRLAAGLGPYLLRKRLAAGKEDPVRWREKLGEATVARPAGRLIWVHAVSVGEGLSILPLLQRLVSATDGGHVLLTMTTVTGARLMAERAPAGCVLQFLPIDTAPAVRRFLDHWHPDVAVMVESEFWPRLIHDTHARGIPLVLANARMSDASVARWGRMRGLAAAILGRFSALTAPDDAAAAKLVSLGAPVSRVTVTGSLKRGADRLPVDADELARLTDLIGMRPRWLAASTHAGEEDVVATAARAIGTGTLLVLAPRHPNRASEVRHQLEAAGLRVAQRSLGEMPTPDTAVYLADTLGEMGLWFDLCPTAFIGGSLQPIGGHNAYEPALHGCAILHGPHVENFARLYERLDAQGGAALVTNAAAIADCVLALQDEGCRHAQIAAARAIVAQEVDGTEATARIILSAL